MQAELRPGDRIAGCVVESELGRGGMGVVYRARQESLQRTVAVKVISPALAGDAGFARRFEREARLAASIEHPSVVPIHAAGEEDGRLYLVMRFVDGTDLFNEVASHGPLAPQRVARLAGQLAGALDAAHARGLVHRDVKPANVLLSGAGEDEHALLTDFGLTKEAAGQSGLTATGQLLGTLDYVAPEQLDGRELDARTDVYALGCLLFECLTGHPPFAGTPAAKMYAHINSPPPAVEGLASALGARMDEALARAMAKEPAHRFPSAGDLGRALAAAVQDRPNAAPERSVAVGPAATQVGALGATVIDGPPAPPRRREPRLPA
ncbi:MAG: serine/threonine protein kinase, partial [Actinomycetota bacterium]|nr:serine/threonine protein kinase [Actinomycetota bacterium]